MLVSHPHFDHDAVDRAAGSPMVIAEPTDYVLDDVRIRGFMGRHAGVSGAAFGHRNVIFIVETGGLMFCHLGDNSGDLPSELGAELEGLDALMLPVDGSEHILKFAEIDTLIEALRPRIIIPHHYLIPDLTDPDSGLLGLCGWLGTRAAVKEIAGQAIEIRESDVPAVPEVWVFESCAALAQRRRRPV